MLLTLGIMHERADENNNLAWFLFSKLLSPPSTARLATLILTMCEPVPIPFKEATTEANRSAFQIDWELGFRRVHYSINVLFSEYPKCLDLIFIYLPGLRISPEIFDS